jgi:hypothetical protein
MRLWKKNDLIDDYQFQAKQLADYTFDHRHLWQPIIDSTLE